MSASQSNLHSSPYGYDIVVATTQASINATMEEFLAALTQPVVTCVYVADTAGNPAPIAYDDLLKAANGSDPFKLSADTDPSTSSDIKNLVAARFMMGFRAQLGMPPGLQPHQVVSFASDSLTVRFNLLCAQFTVVSLDPGGTYTKPSWFSKSQPADDPWVFSSTVPLRAARIDKGSHNLIPAAVQSRLDHLGGDLFSVQRLFFDLDNAMLNTSTAPTIQGVLAGSKLYTLLQQEFLGAYFAQLRSDREPVLGCVITPSSAPLDTITLTDFNLEVCPLLGSDGKPVTGPILGSDGKPVDATDLTTLNYLCAANGRSLPPPARFGWNWVEGTDLGDFDGIVALNRDTFVAYLRNKLQWYASRNCYLPSVSVTLGSDLYLRYVFGVTSGQTPTVTTPASGSQVLTFHYSNTASDKSWGGAEGSMELTPTFDLAVSLAGNTMTIVQHLVIYVYVNKESTADGGNVVDKTITDTYTLAVNDTGRLVATLTSKTQDNSRTPSVNGFLDFFSGFNKLSSDVAAAVRALTGTNLTDLPVSVVQDYVFPGGRAFAYKSVMFSDNQDLISHITYTDPS
jgi:hypothetical protein